MPASTAIDFQTLFEKQPGLQLVLSPQLNIVAVTDAYCAATLIKRDQVIGQHLFDVFPDNPDDPTADGVRNLRDSLKRVLRYRRPDAMAVQKYDIRRPESEGGGFEERYWTPLNTPVLDAAENVAWIIHRVQDVTELMRRESHAKEQDQLVAEQQETIERLRRVEAELRDTQAFMTTIVENMPGMLFAKDAKDLRMVLYNRAALEMAGLKHEEVIGRTDFDLFPAEQAERFQAFDRQVLDSGRPTTMPEEPITTRHNGMRLLQTTKVPVYDENGKARYLIGISDDITDKRAMEQQLRQAMKMEAVGQLTGGVAHDFNNLLGVVIGNIDMVIERTELSAVAKECLQEALSGALRGAELTRRLLAFSRTQPLRPGIHNLNEGLPQIAKMLARTLGEHITVKLHPAPDLGLCRVDAGQLDEAILNLAINARDAMARGGELVIETANVELDETYASHNLDVVPGQYVMLAVSDTGTGMPQNIVDRAFEPFFTTKETDKGTGLGLSMVYGFVKQTGGHVKIYSEVGVGTSVKIYLPRSTSAEATSRADASSAPVSAAGRECILVVEDNHDLRAIHVRILNDLGYQTLEADAGKAALALLAARPEIDLLFTDIVMPGGFSGADLARDARALYPNLKILLTTGYARAMANGLNGIPGAELLNKPFRKHELAAKLRQILEN